MPDWIHEHSHLIGWLAVLSIVTLVLSAVLLPLVIARIPEDYFLHPEPPEGGFRDQHPIVRVSVRIAKNVLGVVFLVAGFAMLFVPGQGLLTMFIGLLLVESPGKRRFELWLVRRPTVLRALNWVRRKAHQAPLQVEGDSLPSVPCPPPSAHSRPASDSTKGS